ncbi:MAG TPA: hypothetical protein VJS45_03385 [Acidimicrobiia bacterium]|nr:hypothetical protein [Acidimicrobiia bacterium]
MGESAGAVVTVEFGSVVVVDDGRLVVVDRPVPPEDGMDVLVVEGPGPVVGVDVEVVVVSASSSAGTVVVVVEGSEMVAVVVVVESEGGSVVRVVSTVVDVVALPPPGSGSPSSAAAGPAGAQTITTDNVVRAIARRTRRCSTRISWVRGNGNAVDHIGPQRRSSPF